MKKIVNIKLLPIWSPTCQALIQEQIALQKEIDVNDLVADCKELLVIHLDCTLIAYGTFDLLDGQIMRLNSLHFRNILKDHNLAQYWLSRHLNRILEKKCYLSFLIAS